jgi:hypothetical protein
MPFWSHTLDAELGVGTVAEGAMIIFEAGVDDAHYHPFARVGLGQKPLVVALHLVGADGAACLIDQRLDAIADGDVLHPVGRFELLDRTDRHDGAHVVGPREHDGDAVVGQTRNGRWVGEGDEGAKGVESGDLAARGEARTERRADHLGRIAPLEVAHSLRRELLSGERAGRRSEECRKEHSRTWSEICFVHKETMGF